MKFDYVSQSGCDVCAYYDGMTFGRDSPNRPIIPRLESQGKGGDRPYTHPNCKCRWIKVFNEASTNNSMKVDPDLIKRARKSYNNNIKFDKLNNIFAYDYPSTILKSKDPKIRELLIAESQKAQKILDERNQNVRYSDIQRELLEWRNYFNYK